MKSFISHKSLTCAITDVLTCPSCNHRSENPSSFISLSLDLPDNLESHDLEEGGVLSSSPGTLLSDLLSSFIKPEVLDVDNKWECSGCKNKVQATKAQEVSGLPSRMFLHLKRFRFDPVSFSCMQSFLITIGLCVPSCPCRPQGDGGNLPHPCCFLKLWKLPQF